jgi:hypothetical protein
MNRSINFFVQAIFWIFLSLSSLVVTFLSMLIVPAFSSSVMDSAKLQDFFVFWSSTLAFYFLSILILSICSYCSVVFNKNLKNVFIVVLLSAIIIAAIGISAAPLLYFPVAVLGVCVCCGISIGCILVARKAL